MAGAALGHDIELNDRYDEESALRFQKPVMAIF
jgi:hypothetical protein